MTNRGITEVKLGQLAAARADLSRAIQIEAAPQTHFWLAVVLETQGKFDEAETEYAAALRLDPAFADAKARLDALRKQNHPQPPATR